MDMEGFAEAFSSHTKIARNRFHPLVWINGDPEIGANVYIGGMSEINANHARVSIGDGCDIASFVSINCADSHRMTLGLSDSIDRRDIVLEESVFVGSHCVIKGGAHIGHHSVVAAGTIVEGRKIPPYSLVIGNPMMVKEGYYRRPEAIPEPVPHNRPTMGNEEESAAVSVLRSGWLAQGKQVRSMEDEFAAFLGLGPGHAVAVSSGTAALLLSLETLGAEGKRTALPAYVCSSLLHACRYARAVPHLMDNGAGSPNLDPGDLLKSGAEFAIVPHTYGMPIDLSDLEGVKVIEDCAQALGAKVSGTPVGLQCDVGVFSFYATKLMTAGGQGGMLVSRDRSLADAARDYREFDQRRDQRLRFNFQMTDLQAAIGREQLKKLPGFLERRRHLFELYRQAGLELLDSSGSGMEPVRYRAVLRTDRPTETISSLDRIGVRAIVPLEEWELLGDPALFANAARLCRTTVSLPLYPTLSDADARRIAEKAGNP